MNTAPPGRTCRNLSLKHWITLPAMLALLHASLQSAEGALFQIADPVEFNRIIDTNTAAVTTNVLINTWLEGPVWIPSDGGYLVFCDQNNNRLRKLVPPNTVSDYLLPPPNTLYNGTILDAHERLLAVEAGGAGLRVVMITNGVVRPNGLCFSPDETKLYVADSDVFRHRIHVYSVSSSNTLSGGAVFANIANGVPDGIRCDVDGRIWSSAGDGVHIFAPDGHLIGKILFNRTANLCFGGPQYRTLYMTGQPVVASIPVLVAGIPSAKTLKQSLAGGMLKISWPAPSTGFQLENSTQLGPSANWTNTSLSPVVTNGEKQITAETTHDAEFYRLRL